MKSNWLEIQEIADKLYRSQLDGLTFDKIENALKDSQNSHYNLLIAALELIVVKMNHDNKRP